MGSALSCGGGTGSIGAGGVARVLVPDEATGALRRVSLPWRSGARARDLCRALAHRARITNPQDYGLFAVRDGEGELFIIFCFSTYRLHQIYSHVLYFSFYFRNIIG